ncbi:MAG: hypothetical protein PVG53_00550 [Holophagae bacterium]|jgi:hypothetical protein
MFAGCSRLVIPIVCAVASLPAAASPGAGDGLRLIVCAPGYPGSTAEAQPAMDGLAEAAAEAAGWSPGTLAAAYFENEAAGLSALDESHAGLALVTLPFFLEHRTSLDLRPVLLAVPTGRKATEPWTLVAGAGKVTTPADLRGWTVVSLAGHSERFVRGPALGDWGELPDGVTISFSGRVLTSLRKAARGEPVAVLLDAEQAAALDTLPFADQLEVVHRSPPVPVSVLCTVDDRVPEERAQALIAALSSLAGRASAADALAGVRIERFESIDEDALDRAVAAFTEAGG